MMLSYLLYMVILLLLPLSSRMLFLFSPHLISSHLTSSHLISSHLISSHLISPHLILPHRANPTLLQAQDAFGDTLLHHAAQSGALSVVRLLIQHNAGGKLKMLD
jgi:ankyrin repeat protein